MEAALKRENGVYDFQYAFFDAITETSLEAVDDNECRHILLEDQQSELSVFEESVDIVLSEESIAKRQNILFDVAALLSKTNNMPQPKHNNPAETMKVIAELGAEHFGLATLNKSSEENSSLIIPETINEKLQVGYKEIAEKVTNVDKVVLGTLGITGVDILADGVLDAIPTIAAGLGISVPIVAATAGLIMAGTSSVAIVQDINRLKRTELSSAQNAIIAIQSQIKTKYLESYDEAMQAIRDRIEENLIAATGVNKQIFKKTSAMIAISKIDNDLDIICREVTTIMLNSVKDNIGPDSEILGLLSSMNSCIGNEEDNSESDWSIKKNFCDINKKIEELLRKIELQDEMIRTFGEKYKYLEKSQNNMLKMIVVGELISVISVITLIMMQIF